MKGAKSKLRLRLTIVLLMVSMTALGCVAPARSTHPEPVDDDNRILAGGVGSFDGTAPFRELYLGYPVSNFGFPVGAYGLNINLVPPLSTEQAAEIERFQEANPGTVVFVAVSRGPSESAERYVGRVIGYGFYPNGTFEPFTAGDLRQGEVFFPLDRKP